MPLPARFGVVWTCPLCANRQITDAEKIAICPVKQPLKWHHYTGVHPASLEGRQILAAGMNLPTQDVVPAVAKCDACNAEFQLEDEATE